MEIETILAKCKSLSLLTPTCTGYLCATKAQYNNNVCIMFTARNAGVLKSSLGLSTLRKQGLVNEPCTKTRKCYTLNGRKKCTRSNQETPRSAACPRRCRACVLDEHLATTPSRFFKRECSGWRAKEWPLSDVEDDELALLRSYKDAVIPPHTS